MSGGFHPRVTKASASIAMGHTEQDQPSDQKDVPASATNTEQASQPLDHEQAGPDKVVEPVSAADVPIEAPAEAPAKLPISEIIMPEWVKDNVPEELHYSPLFVFNVKLPNGQNVQLNILRDIEINFDDIETQLQQTPAQYMFWAGVYSEMRFMIATLEAKIGVRRAQLTKIIKQKFESSKSKITDKQLNTLLEEDDKLKRFQLELIVQQRNNGKIYNMVEAVKMKSEHLRSLAGFKRNEKQQSSYQT